MKRYLLSHLGTILIVCLLVAVAFLAWQDPQRAKEVLQAAWSGTKNVETADGDAPAAKPPLLEQIQQSELLSGNSPAEWIVVLAAVFLGFLAGKIASAVAGRIGQALQQRGRTARAHVVASLASPLSLVLFTFGLSVGFATLSTGDSLDHFLNQTVQLLYTIAIVWYVFNLIELIDVGFERLRGRIESRLDAQLIPLIRKSFRVVWVLLGFLYVAKNIFGQDVSAWLAGLGIAGLAVSLAAQDSLKNFFGSITILLDRPFKVGQRIVCSSYDGVVEDIGFRSTKIRTPTGHLVTIPNANIVSSPVENIGCRPFIRRILNVTITYDTPREKIAEGVSILKRILDEEDLREPIHPTINGDDYPPRVFFNDYNPDSLNLMVIYWYAPPAYWDYMEHAERLNLRIFEEFEQAGIEMAFPTQTLYLAGDPRRKLAMEMLGGDLKA
ncbi:MAG: mechanosensitive ion channel family protein [Pirellulales bacterium]|nr:mechanosensitive ion channel family protein [Pirellulales bacterium]